METQTTETYRVGDIVNCLVWRRNVIGEIIRVVSNGFADYDVKLFSNIKDSCRVGSTISNKYIPWGCYEENELFEEVESEDPEYKCFRMKIVCVPQYKISFSLKREDIDRYKLATTNGERFRYLLRGLWKNLYMRKVKFVKPSGRILGVNKYTMDENGNVRADRNWNSVMETQIPDNIEKDSFYVESFSKYYGFAQKFGKDTKDVFFHSEGYCGIDLDIDHTGQFSVWGNHQGGCGHPLPGQYICGTVKKGEKGMEFDEWFTCSEQFFNFWKFLNSNSKHTTQSIEEVARLVKMEENYSFNPLVDEKKRMEKLDRAQLLVRCWDHHNAGPYEDWVRYIFMNAETHETKKFSRISGLP